LTRTIEGLNRLAKETFKYVEYPKHRRYRGDYMGKNYGEIISISEN